ncbi:MAG TPA: heavy metal-binding domain-containing protein [Hyphomicrobiales bacterium]|nr:heavy metal-binding domain-containing protein [Hyphomicrobiales bacterium]
MNADAIVGIRFTTSMVMAGAAELLVYGTAVRLQA